MPDLRIVGIGGGTGLPVLLRGLRDRVGGDGEGVDASAIVCVSDDGGSTGILRQVFGIPAVGDLRNCLVGLSEESEPLADLLQYRFPRGEGLKGHALGNLILAALYERSGSLREAVRSMSELLRLKGRVVPATEENVTLCASFAGGGTARGEREIAERRRPIHRVWLAPKQPPVTEEALECIERADVVVLGPGSLYTSLVANLLVSGVPEAIRRSRAVKVFPCNLMSQPGETEGLSASGHLRILERYLGKGVVDYCVLNRRSLDARVADSYRRQGAFPVAPDERGVARLGVTPVSADLLQECGAAVRHDPRKLAGQILVLARSERCRRPEMPAGRQALYV